MLENMGWVIAGVVAVVGWAIHAMKVSHNYGSLNQRVKNLEDTAGDHREVRGTMIRVESEMKAMAASIAESKDNLVWLTKSAPMYGPPAPPSQPVTRTPRARK